MTRPVVEYFELGLIEYEHACQIQVQLSRLLKHSPLHGYLLFLEHPPVITLGYSLKGDEGKSELRVSEQLLALKGIKLFHADRGGKATFHGPGQLIAYPIFNLNRFNLSSKKFVNRLEDVVIAWLEKNGVAAVRDLLYPGVWVENEKIASVGVRIEDRISRHGIAVNLCPELDCFKLIVPCGIAAREITSFLRLTGGRVEVPDAIPGLAREFETVFGVELRRGDPNLLNIEGGRDDDQRMAHAGSV
jgi:lipoate-protein ligase B